MISGISSQTIDAPDGSRATVLTPHGELDVAAIASLDSAVRSAFDASGPQPRLVVDLSDVTVLEPVVVGVLLDARRRCRKAGGAMALVVTVPEVAAILDETGVAPLFEMATRLEAAVQLISTS